MELWGSNAICVFRLENVRKVMEISNHIVQEYQVFCSLPNFPQMTPSTTTLATNANLDTSRPYNASIMEEPRAAVHTRYSPTLLSDGPALTWAAIDILGDAGRAPVGAAASKLLTLV